MSGASLLDPVPFWDHGEGLEGFFHLLDGCDDKGTDPKAVRQGNSAEPTGERDVTVGRAL